MLSFIGKQISTKLDDIGRKTTLTEDDLKKELIDIRRMLIEADVNYKVAKDFCNTIKETAINENILKGLSPGEQIVKIVRDNLQDLLAGDNQLHLTNNIVMMVGLQGSGKTTSTGKIAKFLKDQKTKNKPLLVALDVYRPAAIEQLKTLGKTLGVDVFSMDTTDVHLIAKEAREFAKQNNNDLLIFDTAGRMHVDTQMMQEVEKLQKDHNPCETLLVIDGSIGQQAVDIAQNFKEYLTITGLVFTKMDSDTRGGAIFSVKKATGTDIKFLGTSEKMEGLESFDPERVIGRILGDGDMLGLIQKAETYSSEMDTEKMANKLLEGKFDLEDFLSQMKMMKKMGGLSSILSMLPNMNKFDMSKVDENELIRTQAIIESMTKKERQHPQILNAQRRKRIALGSGTSVQQVNRLIKNYEQSKKMMKQFKNMDMNKMMNMFK